MSLRNRIDKLKEDEAPKDSDIQEVNIGGIPAYEYQAIDAGPLLTSHSIDVRPGGVDVQAVTPEQLKDLIEAGNCKRGTAYIII